MATPDQPSSVRSRLRTAWTPQRRRVVVGLSVTTVVLTVLAFHYMGAALTDCSGTVRGGPNDGTTGAVWLNWLWDRTGGSPFTATQIMSGAGRGDALWQPVFITNAGWSLLMWVLNLVTGPVCAYNLVILLGYVTSGLGMWALAYYLVRSRMVAGLAAVVFAYSGLAQAKAGAGHVSGVFVGCFPLLVLALLHLVRAPSWRRAALAGTAWATLVYVDAYYLAFSLVLVAGFTLGVLGVILARRVAVLQTVKLVLAWIAGSGLVALVLLVPFAQQTLSNRSMIQAERGRTDATADVYSARALEYVIPAAANPLFGDWSGQWRLQHGHGSNPAETTIFLGYIPLAFAGVTVATFVTRRRRRGAGADDEPDADHTPGALARVDQPMTIVALVGIGVAAFVSSLSPKFQIFGLPTLMPSKLIRVVFPEMRVFARLFVVVDTAVIALAAIGLARVLRTFQRRSIQGLVAAALAFLCLIEALTFPIGAAPVWSYSQAPQVYFYLSRQPDVREVAVYPLNTPRDTPDKNVFGFQVVLDKPLVNINAESASATGPDDIARGIAGLLDPQTVPVLRALGADTIVVQTIDLHYPAQEWLDRLGLTKRIGFRYLDDDAPHQIHGGAARWQYLQSYYNSDVYTIGPGPSAQVVAALGEGWLAYTHESWTGFRPMGTEGQITVVPLRDEASGTARVSFTATSIDGQRHVDVLEGSRVLTTLVVPEGGTEVSFDAPVGETITLRSREPLAAYEENGPEGIARRHASITVTNLDAQLVR